MTKNEVNALDNMAKGIGYAGLPTNPLTGLPEAGIFDTILPVIAGAGLAMIPGVNALAAGLLVGGATGLATGDVKKGLTAGLGAFGGGSLATGLGAAGAGTASATGSGAVAGGTGSALSGTGGALSGTAVPAGTSGALSGTSTALGETALAEATKGTVLAPGLGSGASSALTGGVSTTAPGVASGTVSFAPGSSGLGVDAVGQAARGSTGIFSMPTPPPVDPTFGSNFRNLGAGVKGLVTNPGETIKGFAPTIGTSAQPTTTGLLAGGSGLGVAGSAALAPFAFQPPPEFEPVEPKRSGFMPYPEGGFTFPARRSIDPFAGEEITPAISGERIFFEPDVFTSPGFVAAKQGGMLTGRGDGMSDDIFLPIRGAEKGDPTIAAVSTDEFVVPADVVSGLGNGSSSAGAKQLYAMMDRVRNVRTGKESQPRQIKARKMLPA
jgi:hypothetical protein